MIKPLCILWAASIPRHGQASVLRGTDRAHKVRARSLPPVARTADSGASIKLFCFSFFPRRPRDEEKLPEARMQMVACDGYMLFTDEGAPGENASDITRIRVPEQNVSRQDEKKWLWHRNMAGLTPCWMYLLENGLLDEYDWTLNVELDHFFRPWRVRSTIREMLDMLGRGSAWERKFVTKAPHAAVANWNGTTAPAGYTGEAPLMFAFGNAFVFNKAMVAGMKRQWPLPGLTEDRGCPGPDKHCEQDMVYLQILAKLEPPAQMFGTPGCGRGATVETGGVFPLACWDMMQNPNGWSAGPKGEDYQMKAIRAIANQTDGKGAWPSRMDRPAPHIVRSMINITDAQVEDDWPSTKIRRLGIEQVDFELYIPSRDIPIIHHMENAATLKEARVLLGL